MKKNWILIRWAKNQRIRILVPGGEDMIYLHMYCVPLNQFGTAFLNGGSEKIATKF